MNQLTLALAGNPNCGKTTLFNDLTGSSQYVGNWPGVTVERKGGQLKRHPEIEVQDLPGIYSLSPYTLEEVVSRDYLVKDRPTLIINLIDATNLERNLYLTTQLLELGRPVIVALNMVDLLEKRGIRINCEELSQALHCPVESISALKGKGVSELIDKAVAMAKDPETPTAIPCRFSEDIETALTEIERIHGQEGALSRWYAIKLFERDPKVREQTALTGEKSEQIESIIERIEKDYDDDSESIITCSRYELISDIVESCVKKKQAGLTLSDKIDRIVTNRFLALPIFFFVMWAVYYLSINTIGAWGTDWANDVLFGEIVGPWVDGFLGDAPVGLGLVSFISMVFSMILLFPLLLRRLHDMGYKGTWLYLPILPFIFAFIIMPNIAESDISDMGKQITETSVLSLLGLSNVALLALCFFKRGTKGMNEFGAEPQQSLLSWKHITGIFSLKGRTNRSAFWIGYLILSFLSIGLGLCGTLGLNCDPKLVSFVQNAVVSGVGAVLGFLPQMAVLFLCLGVLEDCGYMARIAFVMDRIFRKFGLSGKSFIPMLISMGCGVPGVMATRTIESERDRRMTIMLTTNMPCSAKVPIIAVLSFAFFPEDTGLITTGVYFIGLASIIISGIILKKTTPFAGDPTPFVMELPAYHMPGIAHVSLRAIDRCRSFVQKAGTVIFFACAVVWFLKSHDWSMTYLEGENEPVAEAAQQVEAPTEQQTEEQEHCEASALNDSMLADIGDFISPVFSPLGWAQTENGQRDWKPTVATITGLIAKEDVVATMSMLYSHDGAEEEAGEEPEVRMLTQWNALSALTIPVLQLWEPVHAIAKDDSSAAASEEEAAADDEAVEKEEADALRTGNAFGGDTIAVFSFLLFNLLCAPCAAAIGAIRREMNSTKWTWFAILWLCGWAYYLSFLVYQLGIMFRDHTFGAGQVIALLGALAGLYMIFRKPATAQSSTHTSQS